MVMVIAGDGYAEVMAGIDRVIAPIGHDCVIAIAGKDYVIVLAGRNAGITIGDISSYYRHEEALSFFGLCNCPARLKVWSVLSLSIRGAIRRSTDLPVSSIDSIRNKGGYF